MKLRFKTDRSVTKKGFKVRLTAACGGFLTGTRGVIKTPGYPNDYSPNLDCVWRVQVTPGRKIRVNFNSIDLSTSDSQCPTDFISLRNGLSELSPLMLINSNQEWPITRLCFVPPLLFSALRTMRTRIFKVQPASEKSLKWTKRGQDTN